MRNVLTLTVGLLMVSVGAIVHICNLIGENSTTTGIVMGGVGIVFIAGSVGIKKYKS